MKNDVPMQKRIYEMYVINFANTNLVFSYKKWSKTERRDAKVMKCTELQIGTALSTSKFMAFKEKLYYNLQ